MKDRVSKYPGRVLITPEDGSAAFYATVTRADEPVEVGTPINKAALLSDDTAKMLGFTMDDDPTVSDAFRAIRTQITTPKYGKMFKPKVMHWFDNVNVDKNSVFQNTDFTSGFSIPAPVKNTTYNGTELYLTPDRTKIMINTGTMLYLYKVDTSNTITLVTTFELPLTTAVAMFKIIAADDDGALLFDYKSKDSSMVRYADFTSKSLKTVPTSSISYTSDLEYAYLSNITLRSKADNDNDNFVLNVTDPDYLYSHVLTSNAAVWTFNKNTLALNRIPRLNTRYTNTIVGQTSAGIVYRYHQSVSPMYPYAIGYVGKDGTYGTVSEISGSSNNVMDMAVVLDYIIVRFYTASDGKNSYEMWRFASGDKEPIKLRTITYDEYNMLSKAISIGNLAYSYDLQYILNPSVFSLPDLNIVKSNENYSTVPYFKSYLEIAQQVGASQYSLIRPHIDATYYDGWIIPNTQIAIMPNLGICCFEHFEYI